MQAITRNSPYLHCIFADSLSAEDLAYIWSVIDNSKWESVVAKFYKIEKAEHPTKVALFKYLLAGRIRQSFDVATEFLSGGHRFKSNYEISLHRYAPGAGIASHTDAEIRAVRLVVNVNSGWNPSDGGVWILSNTSTLTNGTLIPPINNTGFGFATSTNSFHALTERSHAVSYAMIAERRFVD